MKFTNYPKYNYAEDVYYFKVNSSNQQSVTIHRKNRENALKTFKRYCKAKEECEWLGKWNGHQFEEEKPFEEHAIQH